MRPDTLILENFRNIEHLEFDFSDSENLLFLVGENAQGKTNFLEAIYLAAFSKSWRNGLLKDLIMDGAGYSRVKLDSLEVVLDNLADFNRVLKVDGVEQNAVDFVGRLPVVLFAPTDLDLLLGEPRSRRRYFDQVWTLLDKKYLFHLINYQRVLKSRNRLLWEIKEGRTAPDDLNFWDEKLVKHGEFITAKREELVNFFNHLLADFYHQIAGEKKKIEVQYCKSYLGGLADALQKGRSNDIRHAVTHAGPHRDDFLFLLGDKPAGIHGSRGEIRSVVLACKFAEERIIEDIRGEKPLLLLDDVFSELDSQRKKKLLEFVQDKEAIITTANQKLVKDFGGGMVVEIKNGKIHGNEK